MTIYTLLYSIVATTEIPPAVFTTIIQSEHRVYPSGNKIIRFRAKIAMCTYGEGNMHSFLYGHVKIFFFFFI